MSSPGFGLSRFSSAIMSRRSSSDDARDALQRDEIVGGEEMQIVDQGRHRRIAAVAVLQLERQAFAQVAGEHAARLEALQHAKRLLDQLDRRAQPLGDVRQIAAQVAGLVGHVDEMLADQPPRRIGEGEHQLLGEMIAQGSARSAT